MQNVAGRSDAADYIAAGSADWQDARQLLHGFCIDDFKFQYMSRQCTDVADYLHELADDLHRRFDDGDAERWMKIRELCKPAMKELCNAIVEAKVFLHDCSLGANLQQSVSSIIKLETREAYDVLLHNLIWSWAALDVAILYAEAADKDHNPSVECIEKRVSLCTSQLSRYSVQAIEPRLTGDRNALYRVVQNSQEKCGVQLHLQGEAAEYQEIKCLTFLVGKLKAHPNLSQDTCNYRLGSGTTGAFQIALDDLAPENCKPESSIKKGFSSCVFRSCWLGQTVAVKEESYRVQRFGRASVLASTLDREISLLVHLRNPFIVHIVGWCRRRRRTLLVMEQAHNDLDKLLSSGRKTLSIHAAVDMMLQISKAIEYLHKRGVLHRRIDPSHVLLERPSPVKEMAEEGYARVKLCGFGQAAKVKRSSTEVGNQNVKPSRLQISLDDYLAPEVSSSGTFTRKEDVFSFGILCVQILGGKSAKRFARLFMRSREVRQSLPPDCPSHLVDLISRCLDSSPRGRPSFSRISSTLTYIKFVLMRVSGVQRSVRTYDSVVSPFDEEELRRRVSRPDDVGYTSEEEDQNSGGEHPGCSDAIDLFKDLLKDFDRFKVSSNDTIETFKYNSKQCEDLNSYLGTLRNAYYNSQIYRAYPSFPTGEEDWMRISGLMCGPAVRELSCALRDATLFLHDCSWPATFKQTLNSITKLDTREAYDVLLPRLIWSNAGLDIAIRYYATKGVYNDIPNLDIYSQINIKERVDECRTELVTYSIEAKQRQLKEDRDKLYLSLEISAMNHLQFYCDETQKKCLTFLVEKSKASQDRCESGGGSSTSYDALQLENFEIDPRHLLDDGKPKILGSGSYGYVRTYSWLGQTIAAKVFKGLTHQSEVFKKEASLLARLRNPFIVQMLGWCEKDGHPVLVMESVHTDLQKMITDKKILSVHSAVDIMLQISRGMEYLHKKKIIHRDIKPANVLLEPSPDKILADEGYARVKLCDFGLAKVKQLSAKDQSWYTTLKTGTSYYRAPEVLLSGSNETKYNRKADVFSFGITCSEILAGFTATECYEGVVTLKLKDVRPSLPPDCPSHLADLIRRCWDADPNGRPPFSRISSTLTYIKFILMRISDVQGCIRTYDSVVYSFDEDELRRRVGTTQRGSTGSRTKGEDRGVSISDNIVEEDEQNFSCGNPNPVV